MDVVSLIGAVEAPSNLHVLREEVKTMKKLSVRTLETVKTTAALYTVGCHIILV
jgi:hypothetical protein